MGTKSKKEQMAKVGQERMGKMFLSQKLNKDIRKRAC